MTLGVPGLTGFIFKLNFEKISSRIEPIILDILFSVISRILLSFVISEIWSYHY